MQNVLLSLFFAYSIFCTHTLLGQSDQHPMSNAFSAMSSDMEDTRDKKSNYKNSFLFRTYDGSQNNANAPTMGQAHIPFERLSDASYKDDGWTMLTRPNARYISNELCAQTNSNPSAQGLSVLMLSWLQFIDHDITLTKEGDEKNPISVPMGDQYFDPNRTGQQEIPFTRASYTEDSGTSNDHPRQQVNEITAWIDGSVVYGSDEHRAKWLRSLIHGKMKTSPSPNGDLPPCNTSTGDCFDPVDLTIPFMVGQTDRCEQPARIFVLGDIRGNEQPGLTALHTLLIREHNRICDELVDAGQEDDEENYQYARKIVGGIIQSITYNEVLPALGLEISPYEGWSGSDNANIFNEFATAAYRLGHTMVPGNLYFQDESCDLVDLLSGCGNGTMEVFGGSSCVQNCSTDLIDGQVALRDAFFNPSLIANNGLDQLILGLANRVQEEVDLQIVDEVRNFLFGQPGDGGMDLAAINIQRGRDHGLPDFNTIRKSLNLPPYQSFDQISRKQVIINRLSKVYDNIDEIDPWIGFLAEDHLRNSSVGPSLAAIMQLQFENIRNADRFWFENDPLLDEEVRNAIRDVRLADLIKRNTSIEHLDNAFFANPCPQYEEESYCTSSSLSSHYEWINLVQFGKRAFSSGSNDEGYSDLTDFSIQVQATAGDRLSYRLRSKGSFDQRSRYWSVWIDINQDGTFSHNERLVIRKGKDVSGQMMIPLSSKSGETRMRIAMSTGRYPSPCGSFDRGEVEDYPVVINRQSSQLKSLVLDQDRTVSRISLAPNPVISDELIKVTIESDSDDQQELSIYNLSGHQVYHQQFNVNAGSNLSEINLSGFAPGYYTVVSVVGANRYTQPLIIL